MNQTELVRYLYYGVAALVCFVTLLIASGSAAEKTIGYLSIAILLAILSALPVLGAAKSRRMKYDIPVIYLSIYFLLVLIGAVGAGTSGLLFAFNVLVYLSLYIVVINLPDPDVFRDMLGLFLKSFFVACVTYYLLFPENEKYSFFFANPNMLGLFTLIASFFLFGKDTKFKFSEYFWFLVAGFIIYLSMSRSALGAYLIISICLMSKNVLVRMNLRRIYLFCMVLFLGGCYLYVGLKGTNFGDEIGILSRLYLEKNLYTGRQEIWASILDSIDGIEYLIGKGSGVSLGNIIGRELSAHNSYIQVLAQSGVIGVALILGWFNFSIPKKHQVADKDRAIKFAWVLGISFCALWEVFVFQNHPELSIYTLLVISSMSRSAGHVSSIEKSPVAVVETS